MHFDFEWLLVGLTVFSGIGAFIDKLWLAPQRVTRGVEKMPWYSEYARSLFPVFLLVLVLRSFLAEPFRIPSSSLEPTLLVGDFILVNKYTYGLRLPALHNKFYRIDSPHQGDIVVFRYPNNPHVDYIKRFVALPGDTIEYKNKVLTINGEPCPQKLLGYVVESDEQGNTYKVEKREENLRGIKHLIYIRPDVVAENFKYTVPAGHYFAMGDNRDASKDSRYWGFVPDENLVGKAFLIWFSWDSIRDNVRWSRLFNLIA